MATTSKLPWYVYERKGPVRVHLVLCGADGERIAYATVKRTDTETLEEARRDYAFIVTAVNAQVSE